ncbi:hypothetical protein EHQ27_13005 [Leptospira wolffii]|uniref:Uncharacterized protein n=1 Tax=Leptospira wolffii TaxID=409998 RepID=A0A2M9ZEZ5_9LEPT|nr:hypothetical protein [Leptospira wolffii]EPG64958.1 hypothetical protein LEP1GSC061_2910 [Leptospira wolffii serovar Khorat str. Khorat-H2]PJZ66966.1 hypothetical protein CH371_02420 [Leptospira wolffii]TGK61937.1 hypothetical protein EHQ32_03565 [Leptospira wolffii]TGK68538.1 hypothetical protein EHQ27_13005 [Leptospira wolffii]TGK74679.1 hypothetical protein EHQ35_10215 [Leptospira wolffii]
MKFEKYSARFAELKAKAWGFLSPYWKQALEFSRTERFRVYLVTLPLFGNWLLGFTFFDKNPEIFKYSKLSLLNVLYFIAFLFLSWILSWIPLAGPWLANIAHLSGIGIYLGLSGFLLYNYTKGKKLVPKLPQEHLVRLEKWLF